MNNKRTINKKIGEENLEKAVLYILKEYGPLTTSDLKKYIKKSVNIQGSNLTPLVNRNDTAIDQIIRNIVSHRYDMSTNIIYKGYINYINGLLSITNLGVDKLEEYILSSI